jgi:hypothetical protein
MLVPHGPLLLRGQEPAITGTHRALYELPDVPALIVKIMLDQRANTPRNFVKHLKYTYRDRIFPAGRYRFLYREYKTYIDLKLSQGRRGGLPPVADLHGFVETDLGMGMLAEKVASRSGRLGRSIEGLLHDGRLDRHLDTLTDFAQQLFDWKVRVNDLNPRNVVLGYRGGEDRFVIVDGLGDSNIVPLRSWSTRLNDRALHKRLTRMAGALNLQWDAATHEFRA